MIESNERIKSKVADNLEELRKNLRDPADKLDLWLKLKLKTAYTFMNELKQYRWKQDADEITDVILL